MRGHLHTFVCLDIYIHGILRLYLSFYSIINKLCFKLYYPRPPSDSEFCNCNPLVKKNQKILIIKCIWIQSTYFSVSFLWVLSRFYSAFHLVLLSHVLMWLSYLYGGWNLLTEYDFAFALKFPMTLEEKYILMIFFWKNWISKVQMHLKNMILSFVH